MRSVFLANFSDFHFLNLSSAFVYTGTETPGVGSFLFATAYLFQVLTYVLDDAPSLLSIFAFVLNLSKVGDLQWSFMLGTPKAPLSVQTPPSPTNAVPAMKSAGSDVPAKNWIKKAAIPLQWFLRWFATKEQNEKTEKPFKLNAIMLEDRILYSASPFFALGDYGQPDAQAVEQVDELLEASIAAMYAAEAAADTPAMPMGSTIAEESHPTSGENAVTSQDLDTEQSNLDASSSVDEISSSALELPQDATSIDKQLENLDNLFDQFNLLSDSGVSSESVVVTNSDQLLSASDVVLIDLRLDDSAALIDAANPNSVVFTYDSLTDSASSILDRVERWAEQSQTDIGSLSILSHGSSGAFELGNQWITLASLPDLSNDWQQLAKHFVQGADIYILGCNVGANSDDGQLLIERLGSLTNSDVFASSNITGVGGDWTLEMSSNRTMPLDGNSLAHIFDLDQLQSTDVSLAWYNSTWQYRQTVTVNESMVTGTTNLSNFAVLVSITDANLRSTSNGGHVGQIDGGDLVFTSSDGTTKLDHQIESYNATTGTLLVWVEVPTLSYNVNTDLYLYYGNAAAADQWNNTGTWESNYKGVWHLGSDYNDSTSTGANGTNNGTTNFASAMIGAGDDFNGTSANITTTSTDAKTANTFTVSLWFNADATDFARQLLWQGQSGGNGWGSTQQEMHISLGNLNNVTQESNFLTFFLGDDTTGGKDPIQIKTAFTDTTGWHYVSVVVSNMSTTPTATMYLDGISVGSDTGATTNSRSLWDTSMIFGKPSLAQRYYDGGLDEIRLATTNRSADWIAAEYNNQNAPGSYVSISTEQTHLVNVVPGSQSTSEDTNLVFSSGNSNQISINDQDPSGSNQEVTLTVTNGTLTLNGTTGLTFTTGDGTTDSTMTFRGTVSNINTALNGLTYIPTSNYNGSASLTFTTTDSSLISLNIDANSVGLYQFSGNANDTSPGTVQNGTLNGNAAIVTDGTRGQVLSLDGSGDYVRVTGTYSNPTDVTIGGWVNLTSATGRSEFISLSDRVHIALDDSGTGVKGSIQTGASSWTDLASGRFIAGTGWHHVMYVYSDSGNTNSLYIDGVVVATASIASSVYWTGAGDTYIGVHPSLAHYSNGFIDDARIYNRALTAAEVAALASDLSLADTASVNLTLTAVNDAPTITNAYTYSLTGTTEDATSSGTLASAILTGASWADVDSSPLSGLAITAKTGNGTWQYSTDGTTWNGFGTVSSTSALLITSTTQVRYIPDGNNGETATFSYKAWDQTSGTASTNATANYATTASSGGTSAFSSNGATAQIVVSSVNDAPVLADTALSMTVTEDAGVPSGVVGALISTFTGGITDIDSGAAKGIAITASVETNGTWYYTTNNGSTWTAVGTVASNSALLLADNANTRLYFAPGSNYNGTSTSALTLRGWDQTSGSAGTKVSTTTNGATTAFSSATDVVDVSVTVVNDAPVLADTALSITVAEDAGAPSGVVGALISTLTGGITDVDSGAVKGIAITASVETNGTWYYTTNNGSTWTAVGTVSSASSLLLADNANTRLYFAPGSNYNGTSTSALTIRGWDQTSGSAGTKVSTSTNGTTTAFSSATDVIDVSVTAVNDAPVLADTALSITVAEDAGAPSGVVGALISTLTGGITDVDSGAVKGIAITASVETNGTWYYTTNNGSTWTAVGTVNATSALLLADNANTRVYFAPGSNYNGTSSSALTIRGWDQTGGTAGTKVDVSTNGGITAFSSATDVVDVSVTAVNDAPVLDNTSAMTLTTITEDQTTNGGQTVASIILSAGGDRITDIDSSAIEGIAIGSWTLGSGTWQYSIDSGSTWSNFGSVGFSNALLLRSTDLVRFVPNGQNATTGDITFRAWDQTSGTAGTKVDTSTNGGTSAFSTLTEVASITVTAVNDEQVIAINTGLTVAENSTGNQINNARLSTTDVDNTSSQLTYTITAATTNGTMRRSGTALGINSTFTQADLDSGILTYDHNGSETNSDSFSFSVDDGAGSASTGVFNLTITPVNDAPVLADTALSITVAEDAGIPTGVVGSLVSSLTSGVSDADSGAVIGIAITASVETNGTWYYTTNNGTNWTAVGTVSSASSLLLADNGNTRLYFAPGSNYNGTSTSALTIRGWDQTSGSAGTKVNTATNGTTTAFSSATDVVDVSVTAVNDAPVLADTALSITVAEDAGVPSGVVGALISTLTGGITDVDSGAVKGIAITASVETNGTWYYTTNNGSTWTAVGTVNATSALLLADNANTRVYFAPGSNYNGTSSSALTIRGWDQTSGTAGTKVDVSTNGGITAFSSATDVVDVSVTAVNDAPVLDNTGTMTFTAITEDQTTNGGNTVASIISSASGDRITDVDASPIEGIAITALTSGNGTWQYSTDGGSSWSAVGAVSNTSVLLLRSTDLVRFVPDAANATAGDITFRAWDQTSGTFGTKVDASTNGTTTAFSTATEVASITVTAVNDAPTITNGANVSLTSTNEDTPSSTTTVSTLLSNGSLSFADIDSGAVQGIAVTAATGGGSWQYSTDGVTWVDITGVTSSNALLLNASTQIRFNPDLQNASSPALIFRAWDQTSGTASTNGVPSFVNPGSGGGTTGFSSSAANLLITVTAVNDAPVLDNAGTMSLTTITEDQTANSGQTVASIILSAGGDRIVDFDSGAVEGIAITSLTSGNGTWQYSIDGGSSWTAVGAVSNNSALLLRATDLVRFVPDGANATSGDITFRAWDQSSGTVGTKVDTSTNGNTTAFSTATEVASISVTAVNDAPVLDNAGSMTLTTINEDNTSNSGNTVASIVASAGGDRIADVDTGAIEGIAITSLTSGNGTWEYSTDGGSTWTAVGTVSNASALLLRSTDSLRFVPNGQNATTGDVTFRAWDQSSGTFGTKVDTSVNGATTPFSSATEIASIVVTAVNDAPTIVNAATVNLLTTTEDSASTPTSVTTIVTSATWADVDTGAVKGIAVTGVTGNGTWQYSTDGTTWNSFGTVNPTTSLILDGATFVRYLPDSLNGETATFSFRAWDQTTGAPSTNATPRYADASVNGGTTAYSAQSATAQIVVTSLNDAAVALGDTATADEAGGYANATAGANPSGSVLTNDYDVDTGDTLSVTGVATGIVASAAGNVGSSVAGTYGSISIAADGSFTYTVDNNNAIVQALRTSGQTVTDTFTYTIQDTGGAFTSTQIVVTVRGSNDAPTAVADSTTATEAGGIANGTTGNNPTGSVLTNDGDVDSSDTKTVTGVVAGVAGSAIGSVGSTVTGSYGSIAIAANGSFTYNVDNSNASVQALRTTANTLTDTFTYTMVDAAGLSSTTQIVVTIQGQNDTPVAVDESPVAVEAGGLANGTAGSNPTGNVLANDTDVDAGDGKSVIGIVSGPAASASGSVGSNVVGSYGSISIAANGSYTYTVDNSNTAVQGLRSASQTLSEVFVYTMQDTAGASSTATVTIAIQGANDSPVAIANTAIALEAGGISNSISGTDPSGNVLTNDTDVDTGDTKTVIGVVAGAAGSASGSVGSTVTGTYGSIVINSNGTYSYTLNNSNATVEALNTGSPTLSDTFTYTLTDTAGLTSTTTIVITIEGADDLPFAVADMDTAVEAGGVNNSSTGSDPSGNVLTNDVAPNGETVVGVAAGIVGSSSGSVNTAVSGSYGTVTIAADGSYSYTIDNNNSAVQALRLSGDHLTDIFTYTMRDSLNYESSTQLTITLDGANDAPIANDSTAIAVEAGGVSNGSAGSNATGNALANDTDVDAGDSKSVIGVAAGSVSSAAGSVGASVTGTYGAIVINNDGTFTFVVNNSLVAVQALRTSSQTLSEVFTYTMEDTAGLSSTAHVTITIQGANDTPLAVTDNITAVESGGVSNGTGGSNPTGNFLTNDTDVDAGDTKTVSGVAFGTVGSATGNVGASVNGSYGSISIAADGSYIYTVDNSNSNVQALRTTGNTLTEVFTYTVTDTAGATSTTQVTVTIQGSNDTPTSVSDSNDAIEASGTANGTTGSNPTGNVLTNDSDVDAGDTLNVSGVAAGTVGSASGSVGASVAGAYGSLNIASNGSYVYVVDNSNLAVQALLSNSDTLSDTFTYTIQDAAGATSTTQIVLTIHGRNDAPVGFADTIDAYEAGGTANGTAGTNPTGNVISNDIEFDSGDTTTVVGVASGIQGSTSGSVASSVSGAYGSVIIAADGTYTYSVDNTNSAVQALRLSSHTLTDVFSYTIQDAGGLTSTTQITVTVRGTNDAPVGVVDNVIAVEAGGLSNATSGTNPTGNVLGNDTDVDNGDTKIVSGVAAGTVGSTSGSVGLTVVGTYGSVTIAANGSYAYTVDNSNLAVEALRTASDTITDVFSYTVTDALGLTSTTQITVTIQGANDAPYDLSTSGLSVVENSANSTSVGTITRSDLDASDAPTYSLQNSAGGRFAINASTGVITVANGSLLNYEIATSHSITVRITDIFGSTYDEVFTVNLSDFDEFDVSAPIDINGATNAVNENAAIGTVVGITASASDADATTNVVTYSLFDSDGGNFTIDANTGVVTTAAALNRETLGATRNITVRATSTDGSMADTVFTININDLDEFDTGSVSDTNATANSVTENASIGAVVGITAMASDADATTNTVTYSLQNSDSGNFAINTNTGVVTVATALNRETLGPSRNITVRATSTDGSYTDQVFSIAIVDADEFDVTAPTDSDATANAVNENASIGTTVGVQALAADADATTNTVTYSLFDNDGGNFTIDANTGVVTTAALLNREALGASRSIIVRANSADGSTADTTFTININDLDEFDTGSVTDTNATANSVTENASIGTVVGITAMATDVDATTNTVTYSLQNSDSGNFAINTNTGVVTVAAALNRETLGPSRNITVRATSTDGSYTDQVFAIAIVDADEFDVTAPTDANATANAINENASIGTTVGVQALAADADATNNTVTYSLFDNDGGNFAIDANTGVVATAALLNREALGASRSIIVRATSTDGSSADSTFTININDLDEFDTGSVTDTNATANSVTENASIGTVVGITAMATDADATTNTVTYSLQNSDSGNFAIDTNTGVVTVAAALNRETLGPSRNITIRATSTDGSYTDQVFSIAIVDADEFDVTAPTDSDATANAVIENASIGTAVGVQALAADADATNNTVTYSLFDNDGGNFTIDANTGVVTTAALLNREVLGASRSIIVRATSTDGSSADTTFTININDLDEFDTGSVTDTNATANSVTENASIGTVVGITAMATDADATTNTVTYSLQNSDSGNFAINTNTGVVTVAAALNRETLGASRNITIRATSTDGSYTDQVFSIAIVDANEFAVTAPTDSNATANSVNENAAIGTAVGVQALAADADATTNTVTYSLFDNDGGNFTIDANTGVVTTAALLNREVLGASRSITVRATSADGSSADTTFTININDLDEFDTGSVSDTNATANSVTENASIGTVVGITAMATDADATTNTVTYSLQNSDSGNFAIDTNTGVVTVAAALNRETLGPSRNITVRATSTDGSYTDQVFAIVIVDADEFDVTAPTDSDATANAVNENASIGTAVGIQALAADADATINTVTYSLFDNDGGNFTIDANTGVVTTAALLNREVLGASRSIIVRANSADGSSADTTFTISINDLDEFDTGAVTDSNATANLVAENAANGTVVGVTAFATDADATTNTMTYSLDDDAGGRFAIHSATGVVTVADGTLLNYEAATSHNIIIRATSADTSSSTQTFTINLTDVNESGISAVSDSNAAANTVLENSANGTTVGLTGLATDADGTDVVTYSLNDDASGRFAINSSSGIVTVAGSLDRETAASYNIIVRATSSDTSTTTQTFTINLGDVDEFNVGTVSDSNATANSVIENAANGTVVNITGLATDADATTNAITYSLFDDDGGRFAINSSTGVVTVNGAINRETDGASRNITIRATSVDTSYTDQVFSIAIVDADEFNVTASTDSDTTANAVNENAAIGTAVGVQALAADADATTNTVTYSLFDNDGGNFTIDANTGVVTTAALLNREVLGASRSIIVRANSADGSSADTTFTISINDLDEFDTGAVTDSNATANLVAENATNGAVVGLTAFATDADATTNTMTYSLDDDAGGRFAINSATGVVTVADGTLLNYEAATSHNIIIRATSADMSTSTQTFTINLTDVNESGVSAVSDSNAAANTVLENSANGTTVGLTGLATDADGTDVVTYSLDDDASGRFAINSSTGVVTVAGSLDRETAASYNIIVRATSSDTSTTTQTFTINLGDVDEFNVGTVSDSNAAANSVVENAANGTVVNITGLATDADATTNAITYSLFDDDGGRFAINSSTGVVTVNGAINRETDGASRNITIRATSVDTSYTDQVFSIAIVDANEFSVAAPTDSNATVNAVNENAAIGTTVGVQALAADADATTNTVTYSLFDNDGGNFTIDANTGVVTTAALLNREVLGASRSIIVRANSADGSSADTTFTISINDLDEFDTGAVTDSNATANLVAENATNGAVVGLTAFATDADATTNTMTYSLDDDAGGRFAINSSTGVVTVADGTLLNYEAAISHNIIIRATSADTSSSTQTFTINLTDVNESGVSAVSDSNAAANAVLENSANGTTVGLTGLATDADGTDVVTYSLDDDASGRFAINTSTGVVTVAGSLDRETAASYNIIVRATSSDTSTTTQTFTINLGDVDEFNVGTVSDSNAAANSVVENAANGTVVNITGLATDADATTNAITYSLLDDDGGRLAINSSTGVVTVNGAINRETDGASRNITIRATSTDTSYTDQVFSIAIVDADEFDVTTPTDSNATVNAVNENAAIGTAVGVQALAADADATTNTVTYSLFDNDGGNFTIDANTGVVTTAALLNREVLGASRSIVVRANSADGSSADTTFTISINDLDEFDTGAVTDSNAAANLVAENATNGAVVGLTAFATDADATTNTMTYSLDDDAGGRFAINSSTGVVTVADGTLLNYEAATSHNIIVRATSADTSSSTQNITINLTDINEASISAISDFNAAVNAVMETSAIGTTVGLTGFATDADGSDVVTYALDDDASGRFTIDASTGVVTVAGSLDREIAASYNIIIRATSTDTSTTTQSFSISVVDVDEFDTSSIIDTNNAANIVNENAVNGTLVGFVAMASDSDATLNGILYSLDDSADGRFAIDAITGIVTVADGSALNYEAATNHGIVVRATSADGSSTTLTVSIGVADVNESPVGTADSYSTSFIDNLIVSIPGVMTNDSDPDGNSLSVVLVAGPSHGSLALQSDGSFAYTPEPNFVGMVTFTYRVTDGTLTSHNVVVSVAVVMPNNLPGSDGGSGGTSSGGDGSGDPSTLNETIPTPTGPLQQVVDPSSTASTSESSVETIVRTEVLVIQAIGPEQVGSDEQQSSAFESESGPLFHRSERGFEIERQDSSEQRYRDDSHRRYRRADDARNHQIDVTEGRIEFANESNYYGVSEVVVHSVLGTGLLIWMIQGAQILATIIAATPAWIQLDPISVLPKATEKETEGEGETSEGEKLFDEIR